MRRLKEGEEAWIHGKKLAVTFCSYFLSVPAPPPPPPPLQHPKETEHKMPSHNCSIKTKTYLKLGIHHNYSDNGKVLIL
jgi:hypothetical protein